MKIILKQFGRQLLFTTLYSFMFIFGLFEPLKKIFGFWVGFYLGTFLLGVIQFLIGRYVIFPEGKKYK